MEFLHSFLISSIIIPKPPPPWVQNGIIVLPSKFALRKKVRTGGAKVLSQLGEPIKTTSTSSIFPIYSVKGGQYPLSISILASFTAVLYENE